MGTLPPLKVRDLRLALDEKFERRYELKHQGYNLDRIAARAAKIYGIQPREILFQGRRQLKVKPRSLVCFWDVSGLGMSTKQLAKRFEMRSPGVGFAVEGAQSIGRKNGYDLTD